jgi:hypothetical protein
MKYGANGLPEKSGMYWKRGVIYVAIRVNEKQFVFCTGTDKPKEALAFKSAKIAEPITNEGILAASSAKSVAIYADEPKFVWRQVRQFRVP